MNAPRTNASKRKRSSHLDKPLRLKRGMANSKSRTVNVEVNDFEHQALEFMSHFAVICRNTGMPWNKFSQRHIVEEMCNVIVNVLCNPAPSWTPNVEADLGADFYEAVLNRLSGKTIIDENGCVRRNES